MDHEAQCSNAAPNRRTKWFLSVDSLSRSVQRATTLGQQRYKSNLLTELLGAISQNQQENHHGTVLPVVIQASDAASLSVEAVFGPTWIMF